MHERGDTKSCITDGPLPMHLMNGTDHSGSLTLCMKEIGSIMNGWGPFCAPPSFSEHGHSCSNIVEIFEQKQEKVEGK